jgi:hypothetical protein
MNFPTVTGVPAAAVEFARTKILDSSDSLMRDAT